MSINHFFRDALMKRTNTSVLFRKKGDYNGYGKNRFSRAISLRDQASTLPQYVGEEDYVENVK